MKSYFILLSLWSGVSAIAATGDPCTVGFPRPNDSQTQVERHMIEKITAQLTAIGCTVTDAPNPKYYLSYDLACIIWEEMHPNKFEKKVLIPLEEGIIGKDQNYWVYFGKRGEAKPEVIGHVGWAHGFNENQYDNHSIRHVGRILEKGVAKIAAAESQP